MSDGPYIPEIQEANSIEDFKKIVELGRASIRKLKQLDYEALYKELTDLRAHTSEGATLQQLNMDLQVVQAAKDRLAEVATEIMRHALTYRRIADLLTDGWVRFSDAKSEASRKGEATLMMVNFEMAASEAETLHKSVMGVLRNLDSKHESLSRQITCFSLMLKLRDVARGTNDMETLPVNFGADSPVVTNTPGNAAPNSGGVTDAAKVQNDNWQKFMQG